VHHLPSLAAEAGEGGGEFGQGFDLVAGGHGRKRQGQLQTGDES
jgi:hypothetical protein